MTAAAPTVPPVPTGPTRAFTADTDPKQLDAVVLTHAYEGGHPDHDAVAFAVHRAARRTSAAVVEMPFYHAGPDGVARQVFAMPTLPRIDRPGESTSFTIRSATLFFETTEPLNGSPFCVVR